MARPKLLLHPGMHKTGTTAIQESLHLNRDWLAEHGVAYPQLSPPGKPPRKAHHDFAKAVASGESLQHYARELKRAADSAPLTVLSAEPIYRLSMNLRLNRPGSFIKERWAYLQHSMGFQNKFDSIHDAHRAYLMRLREQLRAFDVSVLVYFRRPDRAAESLYKSSVALGSPTAPFSENIRWMGWLFDYPRRIELLREVFDHVETRCYETETANGLLAGFYAALGLKEPPVELPGKTRLSHGNRATLWLRRARTADSPDAMRRNRFWRRRAKPDDSTIWVHRNRALFAAENSDIPVFVEPEPSTLWPSDKAFAAFVERNRPAYEMGYFDRPEPPGRPSTLWTDEMHASADEAFADWVRTNATRLERRKAAGLKTHWDPDPDRTA